MASSFSSGEAKAILEAAGAAIARIDEIIRMQKAFAQQISELHEKLASQRGSGLAKSCKLLRVGPGRYATPASGKRGTKSNLYLAATQSKDATIQTRTATRDARDCFERVQALAGIDEGCDAFKDLVFAAYKKLSYEEDSGRSLTEWEALRASIAKATKFAAPAQKGTLSRLFVDKQDKEMAFDALATLQDVDVDHIAGIMYQWPRCREAPLLSRQDVYVAFQQEGAVRERILDCIEAEVGDIALAADDPRPFSSEEAQRALDQLQVLSDAPATVASAQAAAGKKVKSAISALRKEEEQAQLAAIPIEELAHGKTGAQIDKLQQAGVHTFAELSKRLSSPEAGELPGVGRVKRQWVSAYVDEVVSGIRKEWRLALSADERTEASTRVACAVRAYLELEELHDKAEQALSRLELLDAREKEALLYATDQIDWLMADENRVRAASDAMRAAREILDSKDGTWLLSHASSQKIAGLDPAEKDAAWKAFSANPEQFRDVVEALVPSAVRPPEPKGEPESEKPSEAETPKAQKRSKKKAEPKMQDKERAQEKPSKSQTVARAPKAKPAAKKKATNGAGNLPAALAGAGDYTLVFSPLEYMNGEEAPAAQPKDDGAARAQGTCFSCSVPDGWVFSRETEGRPFVLVPDDPEYAGDMPMVSVLYCGTKLPSDVQENLKNYGTSAVQWELKYVAMTSHAADVVEMHEVAAHNCRCAVMQIQRDEGCYEYYIQPYSLAGVDFLRICFYEPDYVTLEKARAFADELARSVEIPEPATPQCLMRLEERVLGQRSLKDAWGNAMSKVYAVMLSSRSDAANAGAKYCKARRPKATLKDLHTAAVYAAIQYCDVCAPLLERLADLLSTWLDHHSPSDDDVADGKVILENLEGFVLEPDVFVGMALSKKELKSLLKITSLQKSLHDKIEAARERLAALQPQSSVAAPDGAAAGDGLRGQKMPQNRTESPQANPVPGQGEATAALSLPDCFARAEEYTLIFKPLEYTGSGAMPEATSADDGANRAQGDCFSCAIPAGWVLSNEEEGHSFVLAPSDLSSAGSEAQASIRYCSASLPDKENCMNPLPCKKDARLEEYGTHAAQWAIRYALASKQAESCVEMYEVQARNCRCAVERVRTDEGCFEYRIYPYSLRGIDYLRVCLSESDHVTSEKARAFAEELARTVEATGPTTPLCLEHPEKCSPVNTVTYYLGMRNKVYLAEDEYFDAKGWPAETDEASFAHTCVSILFSDLCAPFFESDIDSRCKRFDCHAPSAEDIAFFRFHLDDLDKHFLGPDAFRSPGLSQRAFERRYEFPPRLANLRERAEAVYARLETAGEWDGSMDLPAFILAFFSRGWFFFNEGGLSWDGERHGITNLAIDSSSLDAICAHVRAFNSEPDNIDEVAERAVAFLNVLEADEQLRIPRERIEPGVQKALPEGDLTGITLVNLCESTRGLVVKGGTDGYVVFYEPLLAKGVPQFFSLVVRMLWDLRGAVDFLRDKPFHVDFFRARSLGADKRLGKVKKRVPGAQGHRDYMDINELPAIKLK